MVSPNGIIEHSFLILTHLLYFVGIVCYGGLHLFGSKRLAFGFVAIEVRIAVIVYLWHTHPVSYPPTLTFGPIIASVPTTTLAVNVTLVFMLFIYCVVILTDELARTYDGFIQQSHNDLLTIFG